MRKFKHAVAALIIGIATVAATAAFAEPPDHAKAHGWRKKNDPNYVGYTGRTWERDYGVLEGTCHRKEIGTVLGAVVGGAIGSQVGDGSGRTVAIILGSVIGAAIGREIGRDLDEGDRACVGHALELGQAGQRVRWVNETTGVTYVIAPQAASRQGDPCRSYKLTMTREGKSKTTDGKACRVKDGTWQMQG
jgi:surface antigen